MNTYTPDQRRRFFKNKKKLLMVMICTFGLILSSCGGNSTGPGQDDNGEEEPPGNGDQESRLVSYSQDIQPIFNGSCTGSECHSSSNQESGVDLSSYDAAINSVGIQYGTEIINPGNPDESPIVDKISNDNPEFGVRMPEGGGSLSAAQIDSIVAWIEDDAPDN